MYLSSSRPFTSEWMLFPLKIKENKKTNIKLVEKPLILVMATFLNDKEHSIL